MELFQLRSFLEVAGEGNITRAADTLCLTQPAVTQHIKALERELGMALFDRTGRGVQLTEAGHVLLDHAQRSLALLDETRLAIADLDAGTTGRLVLGAGVTTSIFQMPRWLGTFRERHPGVDVVVRTGRSREVVALALGREIDLGIVTSPVDHSDLQVTSLYDEEIVLVAPPGTDRALSVDELADAPLILFPKGTGFREYLDGLLASAGVQASVKMETDSVEAIKGFVASGLGVSFLPAAAVESEIASGKLARVKLEGLPPLTRRTSVIYRRDRHQSAATRGFLRVLAEICGRPVFDTPSS